MTVALFAAACGMSAYRLSPGDEHHFLLKTVFEGFIPVLGGYDGKAEADLGVVIRGAEREGDGLAATSELTSFELKFDGEKLPLFLESAQDFFPKTRFEFTEQGKMTKTDAPKKDLPVRLPGLDAQRFSDITFLPVELNKDGLDNGTKWSFSRPFVGAPLNYDCEVIKTEGTVVKIDVAVRQKFSGFEDEALQIVESKDEAAVETETEMSGKGAVYFDTNLGLAVKAVMKAESHTKVTDIETGEMSERDLKTTFTVTLKTDEQ
jgi:hypothetical protein